MIFERRNSGNLIIRDIIAKVGPEVDAQAHTMALRPDVYAPVYIIGQGAILMPRKQSVENISAEAAKSAMDKLKLLWGTGSAIPGPTRKKYHEYVTTRDAPAQLIDYCSQLYRETAHIQGVPVKEVHGDATFENIIHDSTEAWWIDPNPHDAPLEREVDLAKIMQSMRGYGASPMTLWDASSLSVASGNPALVKYYYFSHLVRLWKYQPEYHDWVMGEI